MTGLVCGFTGHRYIKNEDRLHVAIKLRNGIKFAYEQGVRTFISGGAVGFDTIAAEAVINFRTSHPDIRLVIAAPCRDQDAMWGPGYKARYAKLLDNADEVVYVGETYNDECMRRRNAYIVENSDMMLCYLNHQNSGTGQTVRMAMEKKKTIYNLCPSTATI